MPDSAAEACPECVIKNQNRRSNSLFVRSHASWGSYKHRFALGNRTDQQSSENGACFLLCVRNGGAKNLASIDNGDR